MKEKAINFFNKIKEKWKNLAPKVKKIIMAVATVVLITIVLSTLVFNLGKDDMVILYKNMGAEETRDVYSQIVRMGVDVDKNELEEILVPESMKEEIILILAERGYPTTGSPYDDMTGASGLTTTDHERKQNDIIRLQKDIEHTLSNMKGVQTVEVILNIAEDNALAWAEEETKSTAAVSITMMPGYKISAGNVSTVKNLVSASVKNMDSERVTVTDATTMLEVKGNDEGNIEGQTYEQQFGFEKEVATEYERKITDLLVGTYGPGGTSVSASVVIDYDKLITEQEDYIPDNNGRGVISSQSQNYDMSASQLADGVAGEENNTDVPIIVDEDEDGTADLVNHQIDSEYLVSRVKRQTEKNGVPVKEATISVIVKDPSLDDDKKQALTELISKAVNVDEANIAVHSFVPQGEVPEVVEPTGTGNPLLDAIAENPLMIVVIGAGILALIILIAIIAAILGRKRKAKKEKLRRTQMDLDDSESQETIKKAQDELDEHKRKLKEMSELSNLSSTKENAIAEEIRSFSDESPEIAASLIRAWLKEDD